MTIFNRLKSFAASKFVQDVGWFQIGDFLANFFGFITSIIYARLLGPDLLGLYFIVNAFVAILTILANLGQQQAAITLLAENIAAGNKEEVKNIIVYLLKSTVYFTVLVFILALFFANALAVLIYHQATIGFLAKIALATVAFNVLIVVITALLQAFRKIKFYILLENLRGLASQFFPLVLVLAGWGIYGIFYGQLFVAAVFFLVTIVVYRRWQRRNDYLPTVVSLLKHFRQVPIKKYFKLSLLIAIDKNVGQVYPAAFVLILGMIGGFKEVAIFNIAFRLANLPMIFLGGVGSMLSIVVPQLKASQNEAGVYRSVIKARRLSLLLVAGLSLAEFAALKYLFVYLYGAEYLAVLKYLPIILGINFFRTFFVGISGILRAYNRMALALSISLPSVAIAFLPYLLINRLSPLTLTILAVAGFNLLPTICSLFIMRMLKRGKLTAVNI